MEDNDPTGLTTLVTGGAGFIGSHIAEALLPRNEVRVVDDLSTGKRERVPDGARFIEGDVRDRDLLAQAISDVDVVFHQAALVSVDRSVSTPGECQSINAVGTLRLLEAARAENARVVVASSAAIYGVPDSVPVEETDSKAPTSPYGVDKLAADHYTRLFASLYDLPTVALRYFNVYGSGHSGGDYSGVIDVFAEQARSNRSITVHGDGSQTRDFVHVSDVVRANLLAATTEHVGEAFNVGTGRTVTIRALAELIRDSTSSSSKIVHTDPRSGDIDRSRADPSKARKQLGFEADIDIEAGLDSLLTGQHVQTH